MPSLEKLLICLFGLAAIILKEPNVKDHLSCRRGEEDLVTLEGREDEEWKRKFRATERL